MTPIRWHEVEEKKNFKGFGRSDQTKLDLSLSSRASSIGLREGVGVGIWDEEISRVPYSRVSTLDE